MYMLRCVCYICMCICICMYCVHVYIPEKGGCLVGAMVGALVVNGGSVVGVRVVGVCIGPHIAVPLADVVHELRE